MLYEERLEAAERLRLAGNALFTAGDATEAMGKCGAGCRTVRECQVWGALMRRAAQTMVPKTCRLRLTACTAPIARCCPCGSQTGRSAFEMHATGMKCA